MHEVGDVPWILLLCVSSYSLAWGSSGKSQRKGILAYPDFHQRGIIEHGVKDQLKLELRGYLYNSKSSQQQCEDDTLKNASQCGVEWHILSLSSLSSSVRETVPEPRIHLYFLYFFVLSFPSHLPSSLPVFLSLQFAPVLAPTPSSSLSLHCASPA